jgi:hypothetical protein
MEAKVEWKKNLYCSIVCCNSAKGRVDFEDGWLIKSSFLTKDKKIKSFYWITKLYKRSTTILLALPFTQESHTTLIGCAKSVPVH